MSIDTLQIVFLLAASAMIVFWLGFALLAGRRVDAPGALAVLRHGSVLRVLAAIFALSPPTLMACVVWLSAWRSVQNLTIAGLSLWALSIVAGCLLVEVERLRIIVTEEGITRFSPWTGHAVLHWSGVEQIRYSAMNRWFIVEGPSTRIRVSRSLTGIDVFAQIARRKVAAERFVNAAQALDGV